MKTFRMLMMTGAVAGAALLGPIATAGAQSYSTPETGISVDEPDLTFTPSQRFSVTGTGFQPFSEVKVYFGSNGVYMGALTADSVGTVQGSFSIPAAAQSGAGLLELRGTGPTGATRVLGLSITVSDSGQAPSTLALTGTTVGVLVGAGGALVVGGAVMVKLSRRREGAAV